MGRCRSQAQLVGRADAAAPLDAQTDLIGTSQDITDRFRRAEAERANRAKNEFISRMSHELRTPLNEILDISRIEAGQLRLSPEQVSVSAVVDEMVDLVTPMTVERSIAISAELENDDLWVWADVQRLKQVLLNLLSNAIKYNRDGGHVQVGCSRAREKVEIIVADDGPGIAPELIERLFSPFERLGAEQASVEGTGLGLALSRGMVEAMGGTISVESDARKGSAFTLQLAGAEPLPLAKPAADEHPPAGAPTGIGRPSHSLHPHASHRAAFRPALSSRAFT